MLYGWKDQSPTDSLDESERHGEAVVIPDNRFDVEVVDFADYEWGFATVAPRTDNWRDDQ